VVVGDEIIPGSSYNWIIVRAHSMVLRPDSRRLATCPRFEIPHSVIASDSISMMDGFATN
jgi:hypothetical protein